MKIKCIKNKLLEIPDSLIKEKIKEKIKIDENISLKFKIGKEYTVYGLLICDGILNYYICSNEGDECPYSEYSLFFEVIDNRPSKFWRFFYDINDSSIMQIFKEWNEDIFFYGNLVDGDRKEVEIFKKYKKLMDDEFDDLRMKFLSSEDNDDKISLFFENQFGIIKGNYSKYINLVSNKWYSIELMFNILLETETHLFQSYDNSFYSRVEKDRLILNLMLIEIEEISVSDEFKINLIFSFGSAKIKIPILPVLLNYQIGEFITLKVPNKILEINVIDD
nr:hypothetical protein GTC16762_26540 [Pigmentibacter ruber]